jgi:hypothetical protein
MVITAPATEIVMDQHSIDLRGRYEAVAQDTLRMLWYRKGLIATSVVAGIVIGLVALMGMAPRYTSEALIQVSLNSGVGTKNTSTISVSTTEVVDSVVRIIRSRTTADAVVARLGLDKDPGFQHQPVLSRWRSAAGAALGLQQKERTPHDLAVDALMRLVRVAAEPRSYLISVTVTAGDPESAARLANAVAAEYLRIQRLTELAAALAAAEHDLADTSLAYGARHPAYLHALDKRDQLKAQISALGDPSATEDLIKLDAGHSLIAAPEIMNPSGPNIPVILTLATLAGLTLGICLARYTSIGLISPTIIVAGLILLIAAIIDGMFATITAVRAARFHLPVLLEGVRRGLILLVAAMVDGMFAIIGAVRTRFCRLSLAGSELVRSAAVAHGRSSNRHRDAALLAAKQLGTGMRMNAWFVPPIVVPLGLALALVIYGGFVYFY